MLPEWSWTASGIFCRPPEYVLSTTLQVWRTSWVVQLPDFADFPAAKTAAPNITCVLRSRRFLRAELSLCRAKRWQGRQNTRRVHGS